MAGIPYSQVVFALGLAAYWLVVRRISWVVPRPEWMRRGSFRGPVALLSLGAAALAGAALLGWFLLARPDVDDILAP